MLMLLNRNRVHDPRQLPGGVGAADERRTPRQGVGGRPRRGLLETAAAAAVLPAPPGHVSALRTRGVRLLRKTLLATLLLYLICMEIDPDSVYTSTSVFSGFINELTVYM